MNLYRVHGGVAKIGPGSVLMLSGQQIKDRANSLELPDGYQLHAKNPAKEKPPVPKDATVKTKGPVEFIVGEIIGLPDLPHHLVNVLVPIDAPKTEIDQIAVAHAAASVKPAQAKVAASKR